MRRIIIAVILVLSLVLMSSSSIYIPQGLPSSLHQAPNSPERINLQAEAQGLGNNVPAIQYMDRIITEQILSISNSYGNPSTHSASMDLSSYQLPGWTLYEVQVDVDNITAIAEREVLGVSNDISSFQIEEYDSDNGWRYTSLAQGFYEMPHDGQLLNYSFYYDSPIYNPAQHGWAYYSVLSDYQNASSNLVGYAQLPTRVLSGEGWENATVASVVLGADTQYYAVINGSTLTNTTFYPDIRWIAESGAGVFESQQYSARFSMWGVFPCEALLNYTYIPWNTTANANLVFANPSSIALNLNGTPASDSTWTTSSASNITTLQISTNQSVNIFHSLTLSYRKTVSADTNWYSASSSSPIMWNVTVDLVYPVVPETVVRFMNITNIPLDWNATGLYLGTSPGGSYSQAGSNVTCDALSDGTWTLTSTAHNYAVGLVLSDSSDSSPIINKVANLVIMDVDATIEDENGTQMTGGTTNLSILQSSNLIYSPAEIPASAGAAGFQWDISLTTDGNNTHSVEVYWISTDGLEAGYITQDVFVFYNTTLVADDTNIDAFTESTFNIGIDFDEISPVRGLDDIPANVTYSFGSVVNGSMSNPSGGRWTQVVDTSGMSNGIHTLTVYAVGFALENQSLIITVNLAHQTQALSSSWSNTNDIAYLDSTNLTVTYRMLNDTRISGATVNVTFQSQTYNLAWDPVSETYWIELTGENFTAVPGTFTLNVSAWQSGYESQYNDTIMITIGSQTGEVFSVEYNPSTLNISYIESLTIQVTYEYSSTPIDSNTVVRVLFNGSTPVDLVFNATSQKWETTLLGYDYLGSWNILVRATADGYETRDNTTQFIVYGDTPTLSSSWSGDEETTDYNTNIMLQITVLDSSGAPINGSETTLTVNVFDSDFPLTFDGNGIYSIIIDPQETRGVHAVNVTIAESGYVITSTFLNLTVSATTDIDVDYISSEYEQWNLTITVTYTDTFYSTPITGATVTVTIDGVVYALTYDSGVYVREILLDFDPGTYTITAVANAPYSNEATESQVLDIMAKDAVYLSLTTEGDPSVEGQVLSIIATLLYNGTVNPPVQNVNIYFIVTIYYVNGTVEVRDNPSQYDTTNDAGVASWGFEIPSGNIESITIEAEYTGSQDKWATSLQYVVAIGSNPLMLALTFFFFTDIGRLLVATILILGIVATAYNKKVKPRKRAARDSLENQLQMFRDLETLRHFMAVYLDRGTCVFYHPFTDERIQPDLISGFIAAITSVYGEIKGDGVRGTLEEIQYQGLRLNSYSGEFLIGILILEGEMTPLLRERLQFFVELFENQYDKELTDWTGLIDCFDPEWVVSNLTSAYNYTWLHAHKFGLTQKVAKTDARILDYISAVRDDRGEFYINNMISPLAEMLDQTEAQVLDRLLYLQDNGMITPVSIQTILQRQGMGLANGEIGPDNIILEPQDDETSAETEVEPEPAEESPPAKEDLVDDFVKEVESLMTVEPEDKKDEPDSIEDFVKDVESLLTNDKEKEDDE